MGTNSLVVTVEATHQSLRQRLEEATARHHDDERRTRQSYARIDAFMGATSRHLAAVDEVLLPEVGRRLPGGRQEVKDYLVNARHLEQAVARLRARLYGEVHAVGLPMTDVWEDVRRQLASHNDLEADLVRRLCEDLDASACDELAMRIYRAELRAPTRAHPYTPHTGLAGLAARRMWSLADRFWDTAQSRLVPPPVRPHPRDPDHQSLLSQYLVGEPLLDSHAPVVNHHRNGHRSASQGGVPVQADQSAPRRRADQSAPRRQADQSAPRPQADQSAPRPQADQSAPRPQAD